MRKVNNPAENSEMRSEYSRADFSKLTRGKFHKQVVEASNVVILDSTVAKEFPNSVAVNKALKALITKRKSIKSSKNSNIRTKKLTKLQHSAKRN